MPGLCTENEHLLSVSTGLGMSTISGGNPPWFTLSPEIHFTAGAVIKNSWRAELTYSRFKIYDDASASSEFKIGSSESFRTRAWKGHNIALLFKHLWYPWHNNWALSAGLGGGVSDWQMVDPVTGLTLETANVRGGPVAFSASQLFLSGTIGLEKNIRNNWKYGFDVNLHYLTGSGLEFDESVEDALGNLKVNIGFSVSYLFGKSSGDKTIPPLPAQPIIFADVPETNIVPVSIEPQIIVIPESVGTDNDSDGIPDSRDNCPQTPREAAGLVDINGCPIDSDADGIPDFRDHCPRNKKGALVDNFGCPADSDDDGVPDGLDDCPETSPGLAVDNFGCVDLADLEKSITLNIKYRPGSFEIDHFSRQKLDSLIVILLSAPKVRIEINGYTDNEGKYGQNLELSRKRANRVRDYLVSLGIDSKRITPIGRGETNFISNNHSPDGRQLNRRVEIVFFK
jgi:outer membrane protein OmpA-like peptidoglycan-associated protein